jgi:ribosomal protein S18 acetylase RimI-like enzyme
MIKLNELSFCELEANRPDKLRQALDLINDVFQKYNAPSYSRRGRKLFKKLIDFDWHRRQLETRPGGRTKDGGIIIGCFNENGRYEFRMWICEDTSTSKVVGVLAIQCKHVYWLFVDGEYQGSGIARKLFDIMLEELEPEELTVDASLYAVPIYRKFGFAETSAVKKFKGTKYIPMKYKNEVSV